MSIQSVSFLCDVSKRKVYRMFCDIYNKNIFSAFHIQGFGASSNCDSLNTIFHKRHKHNSFCLFDKTLIHFRILCQSTSQMNDLKKEIISYSQVDFPFLNVKVFLYIPKNQT